MNMFVTQPVLFVL